MADTDDPKPDEPQGMPRADGELARAYERIKSAGEDLTRLDRLVSGLERGGDSPKTRQEEAGTERSDATVNETPTPENQARQPGARRSRPLLRALGGLLLALGIAGAALAARYGNETKAIMARWTPHVSAPPPEAAERRDPAKSLVVQVADAAEQPSAPAPPKEAPAPSNPKETKDAPPAGATTSAAPASVDVAQSLKTIAQGLVSINNKLEQLKSSHEQTLREHADSIQQLKTAQEQNARDSARIAEQIQALQGQLATLSAKPSAPTVKKENNVAARPHGPAAIEPRRPRRPPAPWMPPPYTVDPYDDPYW
ncbi:hypothetical protein OZ411_11400 [Bradyrhizobium sp. Arg237L]|uniref:hypothetical protein n=1 Tax=Bradyrhizobium sp. Arg237L TaxID=3003352 RepID=UPI00249EE97B|nr:hypothetical protein [Bradyrhizobium sp. Arg237L]MDI4233419.1 hypothetical protein [Bradyrhizobium sp. Arg237L]